MTVGLYARLSPKPGGDYEGVEDQESWGRKYAAERWPGEPVEVFADRGKSAGRDDVRREGFEELREAVRDGRLTHVWAVEQSRFTRREIEWFEFAADLDAAGITDVHTNRDGIVRVGDEVAGIKAVLAASERRKMLRRMRDTLDEKAAKGEPPGVRPFGYRHARLKDGTRTYEIVEDQAKEVRLAATRVLDGWSLSAIAEDIAKRKVTGGYGGEITYRTVKSWLSSPSMAGLRVHGGEVVGAGNWPAILDRATFRAVSARIAGAREVTRKDGTTYKIPAAQAAVGRRYLLTGGLTVCGRCGAPMAGTLKQLRNKAGMRTKPYLVCHPNQGGKGCMGIMLPEVEAYVVDETFKHLDSPAFLDALEDDSLREEERARLVMELDAIEEQRTELAALWGRRELSMTEWQAAKAALEIDERETKVLLAAVPATAARFDIADAREGWEELTLDEQRSFVRRYVEAVRILPATNHGRPGLDPERVEVIFREA